MCSLRPSARRSQLKPTRKLANLSLKVQGKSLSRQAFEIISKIREVDDLMTPELQTRVFEVHPELSFWGSKWIAATVRLRHRKIHAADCANCETKEGMLDHIESDLEFAGRLTPEQRSKLLEIAEKCPVHRTLVSESTFAPACCEQWRTSVGLRSKGVGDRDPM